MAAPTRVLLINPPPFKVVEPWYDTPAFPRQGLASLAACLRRHEGYDIRVIDAKLERIGFDEVLRRTLDFHPHIVGLTAFTNEIKPAARVASLIKARLTDAFTVIGGVHVTALPARTLAEFPAFDAGCVGEGEITFVELCDAVRHGRPLGQVAGLVVRDGGRIVQTPDRPRILDQNSLPYPAYDLFPRGSEYWVMTMRGCPFTCKFCFNPNGRAPRQRTIEHVLGEIAEILDRYAPKALLFADEIFSIDMERTHRLLDGMIGLGVPERTRFWIETHVNFVDEPLFRHLREAGCYQCGLGIETGDEAKLHQMGKGTNVAMIKEAFAAAKRARLRVLSFFIIGQPHETPASIKETIDLAVELNPDMPVFGVMVPYPGTDIARMAARGEAGYRLVTTDWDEFNKQIGGALEFAGLSRWQIEWCQFSGYLKVFLYNGRFIALAKFLWQYRVAGVQVLLKIVRGFLGSLLGSRPAAAPRPEIPEADLTELAAAVTAWQGKQVDGLRYARQHGDPEAMRIVPKKKGSGLQAQGSATVVSASGRQGGALTPVAPAGRPEPSA